MYWYDEELKKFYEKIKDKFKVFLNLDSTENIEIYCVEEMKQINTMDKKSYENYYEEEKEKYERNSTIDEDDDDYDEEYEDDNDEWDEPYDEDMNTFDKELIEFFEDTKYFIIILENLKGINVKKI